MGTENETVGKTTRELVSLSLKPAHAQELLDLLNKQDFDQGGLLNPILEKIRKRLVGMLGRLNVKRSLVPKC